MENTTNLPSDRLLARMFTDPNLLEPEERRAVMSQLQRAVAEYPEIGELRVLLGIALCVNLKVERGIDELRAAANLTPPSFIALGMA